MLADPQSVPLNGTTYSLPRVGMTDSSGAFSTSDGAVKLQVGTLPGKRTRRRLGLTWTRTAPDPLVPSTNTVSSATAYVVLDVPKAGFTAAEQTALVKSLADYLEANTAAVIAKFIGGEN